MVKEITLSLKDERMSDDEVQRILMEDQPFGVLITPEEVSLDVLEGEGEQSSLSCIVFYLTWGHPEQLPLIHPERLEHRPRRLAFRVDRHGLIDFAADILRRFAPHLVRTS